MTAKQDLMTQYRDAKQIADAAKARADLIRDKILSQHKSEWIDEQEAAPLASIGLPDDLRLTASFRPRIEPTGNRRTHDKTWEAKIDGALIPPRKRAAVLKALKALDAGRATTLKEGWKQKKDALTEAVRDGEDTEALLKAYTFALKVL